MLEGVKSLPKIFMYANLNQENYKRKYAKRGKSVLKKFMYAN